MASTALQRARILYKYLESLIWPSKYMQSVEYTDLRGPGGDEDDDKIPLHISVPSIQSMLLLKNLKKPLHVSLFLLSILCDRLC